MRTIPTLAEMPTHLLGLLVLRQLTHFTAQPVDQNALVAIVSGARSGMRWSHVQVFVLRQ